MVQPINLESFVTALACLCSSNFAPESAPLIDVRTSGRTSTDFVDQQFLQLFFNSNNRFSFHGSSDCVLPDYDYTETRWNDVHVEIEKQRSISEKLKTDLLNLSNECKTWKQNSEKCVKETEENKLLNTSWNITVQDEVENLKTTNQKYTKEIEDLRKQHENDKKEIVDLTARITALEAEAEARNNAIEETTTTTTTTTPVPLPPKPKSKNACLSTNKHGVSYLEVYMKQDIFCDFENVQNHGLGWMLIAQRFNGEKHFYQLFELYKDGFGIFSPQHEFFVGLELVSDLTRSVQHELLLIFTDTANQTRYAHYDNFLIGKASEQYPLLKLGNYVGDAGDSLTFHLGAKFSTFDKDVSLGCTTSHTGAWWYKNIKDCHRSNLFGLHKKKRSKTDPHKRSGMIWSTFHNTDDGNLLSMRMYLRIKE